MPGSSARWDVGRMSRGGACVRRRLANFVIDIQIVPIVQSVGVLGMTSHMICRSPFVMKVT